MVPLQPNDGDGLQRRGYGWAWGWRGLDHLNPSPNRVRRLKFSIREDLPVIRCFLQNGRGLPLPQRISFLALRHRVLVCGNCFA
jgi:hypothetical protein